MKKIILCFDGDYRQPGPDGPTSEGLGAGDAITNVCKLHLLFGGALQQSQAGRFGDQVSHYYAGVENGTTGIDLPYRPAVKAVPLPVDRIIEQALRDLERSYAPGDEVFLFGFGRGGAIARHFASFLPEQSSLPEIPRVRFMGLFDSIASLGAANRDDWERPLSDGVITDHSLGPAVDEALHLVALDEKRIAYQPALMNQDQRVMEIWFPGGHWDIGGGTRADGLADIALQFMLNELSRRDLSLQLLTPAGIDFDALFPASCDFVLDLDDIAIQPNHLGALHGQSGYQLDRDLTVADRSLLVMRDDQPSDDLPLLHHSVPDRIYDDADYRPASLRRRAHRIWISDSEEEQFSGLHEHLLLGKRVSRLLKPGESKEVTIYANQKYSQTGVVLEKGGEYYFQIPGNQSWNDAGIDCGPAGWDRTTAAFGMQEVFMRVKQDARRYPQAKWFEVIGAVGKNDGNLLQILNYQDVSHPYKALCEGELYAFPNDLDRAYYNNMGFIKLRIQRVK